MALSAMTIISDKRTVYSNKWFSIVAKTLDGSADPYYSIEQSDCVSILALTKSQQIILVQQYRPALEQNVLELPSGHIEKNESPLEAAKRELLEETGYQGENLEYLGNLILDTGRLNNKVWCYFVSDVVKLSNNALTDEILSVVACNLKELKTYIIDGIIKQTLDMSIIFLALQKGKLPSNNFNI